MKQLITIGLGTALCAGLLSSTNAQQFFVRQACQSGCAQNPTRDCTISGTLYGYGRCEVFISPHSSSDPFGRMAILSPNFGGGPSTGSGNVVYGGSSNRSRNDLGGSGRRYLSTWVGSEEIFLFFAQRVAGGMYDSEAFALSMTAYDVASVSRVESPTVLIEAPDCADPLALRSVLVSAKASGGSAVRIADPIATALFPDGIQRYTELYVNNQRVADLWSSERVWNPYETGERTWNNDDLISYQVSLANRRNGERINVRAKTTFYWNGYYDVHANYSFAGAVPLTTVERSYTIRIGSPDITGDECVDDADLLRVLFAFGSQGEELEEDTNCDGIVDDADLLRVLFAFGNGC